VLWARTRRMSSWLALGGTPCVRRVWCHRVFLQTAVERAREERTGISLCFATHQRVVVAHSRRPARHECVYCSNWFGDRAWALSSRHISLQGTWHQVPVPSPSSRSYGRSRHHRHGPALRCICKGTRHTHCRSHVECLNPSADQAFHSCAPSILAPFLSQEVVFVGLAAEHTGPDAVLRALFGGGVKRHAKPSKELAVAEEASEAAPAVCDLVIQSQSPGGQWNEHMYLDRVTVSQGKARAWRLQQQRGVSPHLPPPLVTSALFVMRRSPTSCAAPCTVSPVVA